MTVVGSDACFVHSYYKVYRKEEKVSIVAVSDYYYYKTENYDNFDNMIMYSLDSQSVDKILYLIVLFRRGCIQYITCDVENSPYLSVVFFDQTECLKSFRWPFLCQTNAITWICHDAGPFPAALWKKDGGTAFHSCPHGRNLLVCSHLVCLG